MGNEEVYVALTKRWEDKPPYSVGGEYAYYKDVEENGCQCYAGQSKEAAVSLALMLNLALGDTPMANQIVPQDITVNWEGILTVAPVNGARKCNFELLVCYNDLNLEFWWQ